MTIAQWRAAARARLIASGSPDPAPDADFLAAHVLSLSRAQLGIRGALAPSAEQVSALESALSRRERGEPLQYILGDQPFMRLTLRVDARALIPRPDTEVLVEAALRILQSVPAPRVLDLCTGSGAIALAIAHARPDARVTATDISERALSLARENAALCARAVDFRHGDMFDPVAGESFDLIACNPPYLSAREMDAAQPELMWEPREALYGGEDGYHFYRRIADRAHEHLPPGGALLLEVGCEQSRRVAELLAGHYMNIEIIEDLNRRPRVVAARRKPEGKHAGQDI